MTSDNHYQSLEISQKATQREIKEAYRRLVKHFHPDSQRETASHEKIIQINAAYEVLGDPQRRRSYDQQLSSGHFSHFSTKRQQRTAKAQNNYQRRRQTGREADAYRLRWLKEVYVPIDRLVCRILNPLDTQIEYLSADPFDEKLMEAFENYLEDCRDYLNQARQAFASQPNPAKLARVAVHLYHCLNQISDGIDELKWFTLNYDDRYLHTGKELFRIARGLRREAQDAAKALA